MRESSTVGIVTDFAMSLQSLSTSTHQQKINPRNKWPMLSLDCSAWISMDPPSVRIGWPPHSHNVQTNGSGSMDKKCFLPSNSHHQDQDYTSYVHIFLVGYAYQCYWEWGQPKIIKIYIQASRDSILLHTFAMKLASCCCLLYWLENKDHRSCCLPFSLPHGLRFCHEDCILPTTCRKTCPHHLFRTRRRSTT